MLRDTSSILLVSLNIPCYPPLWAVKNLWHPGLPRVTSASRQYHIALSGAPLLFCFLYFHFFNQVWLVTRFVSMTVRRPVLKSNT